jgi:hypothetical protein
MDAKKKRPRRRLNSILVDAIYPIAEVKRRLGWTDSALRGAKNRGLKVHYSGKRGYLLGRELLRFIEADSNGSNTHSSLK